VLGFTFFGMVAFYVICMLWIPYYAVCNGLFDAGWDYPVSGVDAIKISLIYCSAVLLSCLLKKTLSLNGNLVPVLISLSVEGRVRNYKIAALVVSISCVLVLFVSKGVTLSVGNYGSRFETSVGTGIYTALSFSIVSFAIIRMLQAPQKKTMISSVFLWLDMVWRYS